MVPLDQAVALVTGASRGIGRGVAEALGEAGATVYVTGRSVRGAASEDLPGTVEETAEAVTAAGGRGVAVQCDHTADGEVADLFERLRLEEGRLHVLVNNVWGGYAGYSEAPFDAPFWDQPLWRWQGMFQAGLRAHFTASRLAAPLMIAQGCGLIVNISYGDGGRYLGNALYDTAKTAVDRLAYAMAEELRPHGVAALTVYPGFVRTERVMRFFSKPPPRSESPQYTGRAIRALAADPAVMQRSGGTFKVGDLARDYGFTDVDGRRVPPFQPRRRGH